jgi:hypothetical protein
MRKKPYTRRGVASALAAAMVAAAATVVAQVAISTSTPAAAAAAEPYSWKNVRIDGGGFVPGIIFNRAERNLIYARTDIGGAYRWNEAGQNWIPLLDHIGWSNWGHLGVLSIATDARDPNRVYAAVGMYTNDWDPNNGAILRSTDRGNTWQAFNLPFKVGGNMPGRGQGERLSIDPNNNAIVYFGAEDGNGLWKSTNSGASFAKVANFPNVGNYAQDPADPNNYLNHNQGVLWVTFDESTGSAGSTTQTIYVGVADKANSIYRSTNGGTSWERIAGQPTGYLPHKGVFDATSKNLYIATSDTGGPYDGAKGQVWKFNATSGAWTNISPLPLESTDLYYGFAGLTIDRQNPNTIMVASQVSWWPDAIFFRSTDAGATWTRIWDWAAYPSRTKRYTMNITSVPWLSLGANPAPPEEAPKLGWMNESVEIDPFNSNRFMYGTGATIYGATNLGNWDTGGTVTITPMVRGLEETAVLDLISPPSGAPLVSGLGDIGGFRHNNLDAVPAMMFQQPYFTSTTSLDYAETNPSVMVRSGNFADADRPNDAHVAFSTDGGANWFQAQEPGGVNNGGTVAASADGSRFVWAPGDAGQQVVYSVGFGNSWAQSSGVPANARIESDRVNPQKFYAYSGGQFYVSTNGGQSFASTGATGLPTENVKFKAVAGIEGDIWLAGNTGLFHSTNSGASFTKITAVTDARNVALGRAAPGASYQAVFVVGTIDGVTGVYRSDNAGAGWVRINDDRHQYGNMGEALSGDPRIYGRVYLGTNGRGILYADRLGGSTSPTPTGGPAGTTGPTPTRSATPTPTASAAPTPSGPAPAGGCTATYQVSGQWSGGFQGEVTVRNTGTTATTGWTVAWAFASGQTISQIWNGTHTQSGANVTVRNVAHNGNLAANASATFGFIGSYNGANTAPAAVSCTRA